MLAEIALAGAGARDGAPPRVETVFFGGGTPTLLPAGDLARILDAHRRDAGAWRRAPRSPPRRTRSRSTRPRCGALRAAGFTRISLGHAVGVARTCCASSTASTRRAGPSAAAAEAREAGFEHVNLDLIYGTPGETADDFAASLDAVIGAGVDHVCAYALIVEDGTRLAARMRRGELPYPYDDVAADRYLAADAALAAAGFAWYEVSNWARTDAARCRHNLLYWTGGDWWGFGPGAHSHVGGVRWWNVKHPTAYAERLADGESPGRTPGRSSPPTSGAPRT